MELKEFVSKAITEIVEAVDDASASASREISLSTRGDRRTIEFDLAVATEQNDKVQGKAGIQVLKFIEAGANLDKEVKNSTVSRIVFGMDVSGTTKKEAAQYEAELQRVNQQHRDNPNW